MKLNSIDQAEFIGGPEDGRIIDTGSLPLLRISDSSGKVREIPMFVRIEDDFELAEGDGLELVNVGLYVLESNEGKRFKYHWLG